MNKILFLIDSFQAGGAEKSILEIAKRMKGFEVMVVVLFPDKDDLRRLFLDSNIIVHDLSLRRNSTLWFVEAKKKFEVLCAQVKPSVVHAHLFKSELVARTCTLPNSTVLIGAFVNDSYSSKRYEAQSFVRNVKLNFVKLLDRLTIHRNFRITSISKTIAASNCTALKYPQERIKLIYRGREVSDALAEEGPSQLRDGVFNFLVVSRLLIRKGYLELINAAAVLKSHGQQFKILAAGEGVDRATIVSYAEKRGTTDCIEFLGYRDDIAHLLSQSNCFIFPSHYEGQGGALIEAMMAAMPIIVSDIDVFQEQITNGETGLFFEVGNATDLADKMLWMIKNYGHGVRIGLRARHEALQRFNIEKVVEEHERFYRDVIEEYSENGQKEK